MPLSFGICAFSEQVDAEIESVVAVAIAQLSAPAPPARHLPPTPEASPDDAAAATLVERCTQPGRACIAQTRERIQATLEWESCDEESGRFRAIARQFDEAFENENLKRRFVRVVVLGAGPGCALVRRVRIVVCDRWERLRGRVR